MLLDVNVLFITNITNINYLLRYSKSKKVEFSRYAIEQGNPNTLNSTNILDYTYYNKNYIISNNSHNHSICSPDLI